MKKIFILMLCALFFGVAFSQTTVVKIIDLSAIPMVTENQNPDSVYLMVDFKVKNVSQAQKAVLKFGTTADNGSILDTELPVVAAGSNYSFNLNGKLFPVTNYQVHLVVPLTAQQYNGFSVLTLYVADNTGTETQHLYFNK